MQRIIFLLYQFGYYQVNDKLDSSQYAKYNLLFAVCCISWNRWIRTINSSSRDLRVDHYTIFQYMYISCSKRIRTSTSTVKVSYANHYIMEQFCFISFLHNYNNLLMRCNLLYYQYRQ